MVEESHLFLQHFLHHHHIFFYSIFYIITSFPEKMWCCSCSWFPLKQVRWWSMLGGNQPKCQLPSRKNSFMTCKETSGKLSGRGNSFIYEIYLGVAEIHCDLAWLWPCPLFKFDFETVRLHSCDARLEGWQISVHFSRKNHPHSKMRNVPEQTFNFSSVIRKSELFKNVTEFLWDSVYAV